jgi:hypothetical protein
VRVEPEQADADLDVAEQVAVRQLGALRRSRRARGGGDRHGAAPAALAADVQAPARDVAAGQRGAIGGARPRRDEVTCARRLPGSMRADAAPPLRRCGRRMACPRRGARRVPCVSCAFCSPPPTAGPARRHRRAAPGIELRIHRTDRGDRRTARRGLRSARACASASRRSMGARRPRSLPGTLSRRWPPSRPTLHQGRDVRALLQAELADSLDGGRGDVARPVDVELDVGDSLRGR